jgi:GDP-4-dehydro-6-deoxy-D-mannose reductase
VRVLVTGAGGFVGQHLIRWLSERSELEITAATMDGAVPPWSPGEDPLGGRVAWVALDVTSGASVRAAVEGCDPHLVFHLAGQSSVGQSFADPVATWDINATGTLRVVDALRRCAAPLRRILVVSSAEVYGAVSEDEQPIPESAPMRPATPYGASKAAAELAALQMAAAGVVEVVVARSFNHAGPGQDERFFFPSMARQLAEVRLGLAEPVLYVGNLEPVRDFLDVRDVVRAYGWLMEQGESGSIYNVCSGEGHTLLALLDQLVAASGTGARIVVDPERFRLVDIPVLVGDPERVRSLGWEPRIPLRQTLQDLLQSYVPA